MAKWLALALIIGTLPWSTNGAASSSERSRSIAFATNRAPNLRRAALFSIRPSAKGKHLIGRGVAGVPTVIVAPNSRRIVFASGGLFVARRDGSHSRPLSPKGIVASPPDIAISPNERYAAFSGGPGCEGCRLTVFVVPLAGGKSRPLGRGIRPSWSADSRHVAFVDSRDSGIYVAHARGRPRA